MADQSEDITLVSGDGFEYELPVALLREHSDYFRALLDSGMREVGEKRATLANFSRTSLKV